ncbi:unnamed protein product, partial [Sphagnum tenellum]
MLRNDIKSTLRLSSSSIAGDGICHPRMQALISEILADILSVFRRTVRGTLDPGALAQDQAAPGLLPAVLPLRAEGDSGFIRGIERALEDALETRLGARDIVAKYAAAFGIPSGEQPQQAAEVGQLVQLHLGPTEAGAPHDAATPASRAGLDDDRQGAAESEPVGRGVKYVSYGNEKAARVEADGSITILFDEKRPWIWRDGVRVNLYRLEDDGRLHCDSGPPEARVTDYPDSIRYGPTGKPAKPRLAVPAVQWVSRSKPTGTTVDIHLSGAGHSIASSTSAQPLDHGGSILVADQEGAQRGLEEPREGSEHPPEGPPPHSPRTGPEGQIGSTSPHSTGGDGGPRLVGDESRDSSPDSDDIDALGGRKTRSVAQKVPKESPSRHLTLASASALSCTATGPTSAPSSTSTASSTASPSPPRQTPKGRVQLYIKNKGNEQLQLPGKQLVGSADNVNLGEEVHPGHHGRLHKDGQVGPHLHQIQGGGRGSHRQKVTRSADSLGSAGNSGHPGHSLAARSGNSSQTRTSTIVIVLVIVPGFGIKQNRSVNSSQSSMGSDQAHSQRTIRDSDAVSTSQSSPCAASTSPSSCWESTT